jgi:hypothetical protein
MRTGAFKRGVFALWATWFVAAGLHGIHVLRVREMVPLAPCVALMAPLILLECWHTARFKGVSMRQLVMTAGTGRRALIGNLLFWGLAFGVWVGVMGWLSQNYAPFLRWSGPEFYHHFYLVWRAEGWLTWVLLGLCTIVFVRYTAVGGRLRLLTALVLPAVLSVGLFVHLTFSGGVGAEGRSAIESQPGVSFVFSPEQVRFGTTPANDPEAAAERPVVMCEEENPSRLVRSEPYRWHPRDVCVASGGDALYVSFGCSFCLEHGTHPAVLRVSLEDDDIRCFKTHNLHHIDCRPGDSHLWAAPWVNRTIYALNKSDMIVERRLDWPSRREMSFFQPIQILEDVDGHYLYAGTELEATLVRFDLKTGEADATLRVPDTGLVRWGGPLHFLLQSSKTRYLYFTSGPGHSIFEANPDTMTISRALDVGDIVGTAMALDEEGGWLYYQCGVKDDLYRIRLDTFTIDRTYEGELHSRRLALDSKRNAIYVLGHFSGTVFAIDLTTGERRWTRDVGGRPHGLDLDGDVLYSHSFAGVFRLDLPTLWREVDAQTSQRMP